MIEFKESGQKTNIIMNVDEDSPGLPLKHFVYITDTNAFGYFKLEQVFDEPLNLLCVLDSELEQMVNLLQLIRKTK